MKYRSGDEFFTSKKQAWKKIKALNGIVYRRTKQPRVASVSLGTGQVETLRRVFGLPKGNSFNVTAIVVDTNPMGFDNVVFRKDYKAKTKKEQEEYAKAVMKQIDGRYFK